MRHNVCCLCGNENTISMFGKCKVCGYKDKRIRTFDALKNSKGIRIINVGLTAREAYLQKVGKNSLEEKKMMLVAAPFDCIREKDDPGDYEHTYITYVKGQDPEHPDFYIDSHPETIYHSFIFFDMNGDHWILFGEGQNDDKGYYQMYFARISDDHDELFQPYYTDELDEAMEVIDLALRGKV